MAGYTLISSIGTGMYKKEGYHTTCYQFPDNEIKYKSSLFLNAILGTEFRAIRKIILVGTITSSWDAIVPESKENIDFWVKIKKECEDKNKGISNESIKELEAKLPGWYKNIPFKLSVHSHEFTPDNVGSIFSSYLEIPNSLAPDTDILFDITHGFRSMPLLIFQSLQLNASKVSGRKIELIYGEYIEDENISHVRNLSEYWNYYEVSAAIKFFEEKFDGKLLAEKVTPYWEKGAKILVRFSEIVECNFSLQIPEVLKQLKNTLKYFTEDGKPQWLIGVKNYLDELYRKMIPLENERYPVAKSVWNYSKLLREKYLITQAIIALQVVVETAISEHIDSSKIGNYDWFYGYYDSQNNRVDGIGNNKLKNIIKNHYFLSSPFEKLKTLRNQIAHGGGKEKNTENYPHQANINGILKPIDKAIQELFSILDQEAL